MTSLHSCLSSSAARSLSALAWWSIRSKSGSSRLDIINDLPRPQSPTKEELEPDANAFLAKRLFVGFTNSDIFRSTAGSSTKRASNMLEKSLEYLGSSAATRPIRTNDLRPADYEQRATASLTPGRKSLITLRFSWSPVQLAPSHGSARTPWAGTLPIYYRQAVPLDNIAWCRWS